MNEDLAEGTMSFDPYALEKIIGLTTRQVPGILALRGSRIQDLTWSIGSLDPDPSHGVLTQSHPEGIEVFLKLALAFDRPGPEVIAFLREILAESLKAQTGLDLLALHVEVIEVLSEAEIEKRKRNRFVSYR